MEPVREAAHEDADQPSEEHEDPDDDCPQREHDRVGDHEQQTEEDRQPAPLKIVGDDHVDGMGTRSVEHNGRKRLGHGNSS